MDSLTLIVKVLDIFVLLVKAFGIAMLGATTALLIRLLPKRIRVAVNIFAAAFLFISFLNVSSLSLFAVTAIRLGIWVVGVYLAFQAIRIADILARKNVLLSSVGVDGDNGTDVSVSRDGWSASYFSSYLRRTPVLLN